MSFFINFSLSNSSNNTLPGPCNPKKRTRKCTENLGFFARYAL